MADLPRHRDLGSDIEDAPPQRPSKAGYAIAVLVGVALVLMIVLHLTGAVGPGGH